MCAFFVFSRLPGRYLSNKMRKEKKEILAITYITSPHAFSRYMLALCTHCEVLFLEYCAVKLRSTALASRSLVLPPSLTISLHHLQFSVYFRHRNYGYGFIQTNKHRHRWDEKSSWRHVNLKLISDLVTCVFMIRATSIIIASRHIPHSIKALWGSFSRGENGFELDWSDGGI